MTSQTAKAERFRDLHLGDPFVMPNPWDAGSARVLAALGFPALATTSWERELLIMVARPK